MNGMRSTIGLLLAAASLWGAAGEAVQFADGSTAFLRPPTLVGAATSFNTTNFGSATYYFMLTLPDNAGEPLRKVVIEQAEGGDRPRFDPKDIRAFEGTRDRQGSALSIQTATTDPKTRITTVIFEPPVPPGRSVTLTIAPVQNPYLSGIYLYGVTVFPAGEKPRGQFIGYGRLQIYDNHFNFLLGH